MGIKVNIVTRGIAMSVQLRYYLQQVLGLRAASKHSKIMVHQLSSFAAGKLSDLKSNAKFAEQLEDDCNNIMAKCTNKDKAWWEQSQQTRLLLNSRGCIKIRYNR
jgi:ATP-dependent protease ClpP protease subunit